jgi:hypothetical protein
MTKYPWRADLGNRERLVMHIVHHYKVPTPIVGEFYKTCKVDRLRKMFYRHYKEVMIMGGYEQAWEQTLTQEEKDAFQPHRVNES